MNNMSNNQLAVILFFGVLLAGGSFIAMHYSWTREIRWTYVAVVTLTSIIPLIAATVAGEIKLPQWFRSLLGLGKGGENG